MGTAGMRRLVDNFRKVSWALPRFLGDEESLPRDNLQRHMRIDSLPFLLSMSRVFLGSKEFLRLFLEG